MAGLASTPSAWLALPLRAICPGARFFMMMGETISDLISSSVMVSSTGAAAKFCTSGASISISTPIFPAISVRGSCGFRPLSAWPNRESSASLSSAVIMIRDSSISTSAGLFMAISPCSRLLTRSSLWREREAFQKKPPKTSVTTAAMAASRRQAKASRGLVAPWGSLRMASRCSLDSVGAGSFFSSASSWAPRPRISSTIACWAGLSLSCASICCRSSADSSPRA